mmetsp:Transcript_1513/g.3214  ORF Transcript_1513/g.3214 Transcript_1513/m.3214 type:complete len:367 (+) Transcript_1513:129-1229(+)|eukprot:CAMPEP_0172313480 /NCGR_PEP_ID=MMETSP1058-20130122/20270_1 /TAXON_ID=83371 /ORGANISM="Detonula confervacea, Strain CCMP 353" /LENGTH=366 /DNA_ID=CAMNT_0013027137 /DNA_START=87 /DNA_END=1187 /DNA_ORIENTATION=+
MCRWTFKLLLLAYANWSQIAPGAYGFSFTSRGGRSATPRHHQHGITSAQRNAASKSSHRVRQIALITPLSAASQSTVATPAINLDATSSPAAAVLDFYANLDSLYDKSSSIKCPFFRRRAADLIDSAAMVVQFLLIRHKSLPGISDLFLVSPTSSSSPAVADETLAAIAANNIMNVFSAPGCKPLGRHIKRHPDGTANKTRHLALSDITQRIRDDWTGGVAGKAKGYYITGKLDSTIYRDDCLFTGPDPDMPVRGLRKYLSAAAHLFDPRHSNAELLSLQSIENGGVKGFGMIEVKWRLGGVIQLPWHPTVEPWTGTTLYHMDEEGLIYFHQEEWDISVWRAFVCTLYPEAKSWGIWDLEKTIAHV